MKGILSILAALLFVLYGCQKQSTVDMEALDNTIKRELPVGTSKKAIVGFLQQHGVSYDNSKDIKYYQGPVKIWGKVSQSHGITTTDFTLTFEFDENDRLVSYRMDKREVGP